LKEPEYSTLAIALQLLKNIMVESDADIDATALFVEAHRAQLAHLGCPEHLWPLLHEVGGTRCQGLLPRSPRSIFFGS